MSASFSRYVRFTALAVGVLLTLFVISQAAQVVGLASSLHPWFGAAVGVLLVGLLLWLVLFPLVSYLRLSPALVPPAQSDGEAYERFVQGYLSACKQNPHLEGESLQNEEDLKRAIGLLTTKAEGVAMRNASQIFLGTAISQYGALDTLIVAGLQARMVWQIAHVYQRRPSLRHMAYLYTNVLTTSFVASNLERVDLSEYVQPVMASMVGQSAAVFPGVAAVATQLSNAVFQGSVNSFLTLRVAMVAIAYSNALSKPQRSSIWRSAVARAGGLLIRTVTSGTAELSKAFAVAAGKTVANTARAAGQAVVTGTTTVGTGAVEVGKAIGSATVSTATTIGQATTATAASIGNVTTSAAQSIGSAGSGAAEKIATTARSTMKGLKRADAEEGESAPSEGAADGEQPRPRRRSFRRRQP